MEVVIMWTTMAVVAGATLVLTSTPVKAGLDCARVQQLSRSGTRPADIARTLGITTPDVQACLAGVIEDPAVVNPPSRTSLSPRRPSDDGFIRRGPSGQIE
jgi:hypothetical protein